MRLRTIFMTRLAQAAALCSLSIVVGCVEQSSTIVSFDTELESTTFINKLYTPIELYRDGKVIDTLPANSSVRYPLGRKGPVKHSWRLIAPLDRFGKKAGIEPYVDLGVQYPLNAIYTINNESVNDGSLLGSRTIFTPLVANYTIWDLRLIVNYRTDDQVYTDYIIPRNITTQLTHAPYFYWNSNSNVRLESTTNTYYSYTFSRLDSVSSRMLELNSSSEYSGSGRTKTLVAE